MTTRQGARPARPGRALAWIVGLAMTGLVFDGYDLVVYGTVVSTFLRDPSQLGPVTPAIAGALGSYALVGVLVGALLAGSVGDLIGRRKVMLASYAWFSLGMAASALADSASLFGWMRFATGLGIGALLIASMVYFLLFHNLPTAHELMISLFLFLTAPVTANMVAKALGVKAERGIIAIDDYGVGLSSLAYLKELPATELKLEFYDGAGCQHIALATGDILRTVDVLREDRKSVV